MISTCLSAFSARKKNALHKKTQLLLLVLFCCSGLYAQTNTYAVTTGNWSTAANWSLAHVPVTGEDVVIPASAVVTVDATTIPVTGSLASLSISGTVTYSTTAVRTITVGGDVTINTGGVLQSGASATFNHILSIGGNFTNNGTFNALASANNRINITFTGAASNAFTTSGTAATTFNLITLTKGANTNVLDFNPGNTVSLPAGFLTLTSGMFKVSGTQAITNTFFNSPGYSITLNGGFWLNNPNATVTAQTGIASIAGKIQLTAGVMNVGTSNANNLSFSGALATGGFIMDGNAILNVSGKMAFSSTCAFNQSNGTINLATASPNNANVTATFNALSTNTFTMSGGTIILHNQNTQGAATIDWNMGATIATNVNITGGTLQLGTASTPNSTFRIQAAAPSIVLDNSAGNNSNIIQTAATTIFGNLTLNGTGTYSKGAFALTMRGNSVANPGNIIVSGTNTLTLNGSTTAATGLFFTSSFGNQSLSLGSGSITSNQLASLTINNTFAGGTVTIPGNLTMINATTLTLTSGIVNTSLLTMGATATATLVGGSSTSYINGALARTFAASRTATGTYNQTTLYPIAYNGLYIPLYADPGTDATGPITLQLTTNADAGAPAWVSSPLLYTNYKKLSRDWKLTITGTGVVTGYYLAANVSAGSFVAPAPESGNGYYLLTNNDGSGSYTDGKAIGAKVATGTTWCTYSGLPNSAAGLPSGGCFTLATLAASATLVAPGGVADHLRVWLKADNITGATHGNPVAVWDNSIVGVTAPTGTGGTQPVYENGAAAKAANYNPSVYFGGANYLTFPGLYFDSTFTAFIVAENDNMTANPNPPLIMQQTSGGLMSLDIQTNFGPQANIFPSWGGSSVAGSPTNSVKIDSTNLYQFVYGAKAANSSITQNGVFYNGTTDPSVHLFAPVSTLGGYPGTNFGPLFWNGRIHEVIMYNTALLTATQQRQINSYLAFKYGLSVDASAGSTLLSNGSTAWDPTVSPSYHRQVVGLVRDDASGILQKQSHTGDDSLRIFIGSLAANNNANTGAISSNHASIMIGNNGGHQQADPAASKPAGITAMFGRSWKITNTNFTDPFSLEIEWDSTGNFDISHIRLLVSASPDFSSATVLDGSSVDFSVGSIIIGNITNAVIPANSTVFVTIGSANPFTTLPVSITDFNAKAVNNNSVGISWQTSSEINNDYFTIERSADGNKWQVVSTVKGAGAGNAVQHYSATDKNPYNGLSYYRLKQTDLDGKFRYTEIKTVRISNAKTGIAVYPNPVASQLTIKGDAAELKTIRLYNTAGQDVTSLVKKISSNSAGMVLNVAALPAGMYSVKTSNSTVKILKQ